MNPLLYLSIARWREEVLARTRSGPEEREAEALSGALVTAIARCDGSGSNDEFDALTLLGGELADVVASLALRNIHCLGLEEPERRSNVALAAEGAELAALVLNGAMRAGSQRNCEVSSPRCESATQPGAHGQ